MTEKEKKRLDHFNKQKKGKNMAAKMSLCTISYDYEHYAGIDVEKLSNIIYEYVKKEFADFNPQVSEPGSDMEMPDGWQHLLRKRHSAPCRQHSA